MFVKNFVHLCTALVLALPALFANANVVTITTGQHALIRPHASLNQGWWTLDPWRAEQNFDNPNYYTGVGDKGYESRSFFTFALRDVSGDITSATLRVKRYEQSGAVKLNLWDVSTSADIVNRVAGPGQYMGYTASVFEDLGSGHSYGSFSIEPGDEADYLDFVLNEQALHDLRNTSDYFTIGASLNPLIGHIFAWSNEPPAAALILGGDLTYESSEVPEPTTLLLFGISLAGLGFFRRKV